MNYQQLQDKIIAQSHRKDMAAKVPGFIEDARVMLNYRLGLELAPLELADDTNEVLTANHLLYYCAAMKALYEFIFEFETASYFYTMWQDQVAEHFVNAPGTVPLVITPEEPAP